MKRWAWRAFVWASLVLLVGAVGMWARAQWACDTISLLRLTGTAASPGLRDLTLACHRDALRFHREAWTVEYGYPPDPARVWGELSRATGLSHEAGPATGRRSMEAGRGFWGLIWIPSHAAAERPLGGFAKEVAGLWYSVRGDYSTLALPWWFLTLLFAIVPARACWTRRRRRRRPPHSCVTCGYDLRATADPAGPLLPTCPECGRATPETDRLSPDKA